MSRIMLLFADMDRICDLSYKVTKKHGFNFCKTVL